MASLPRIGETISGFTVTELGTIHMLGARTVLFNHELSGTQLLYIQNDDRELGFNLNGIIPIYWNISFCPPAKSIPAGISSLTWTAKVILPL